MKKLALAMILVSSLSLSACSGGGVNKQTVGILGGAAVGGIVGSAVTGGSAVGAVVGAGAGALAGHEIAKHYN